MGKTVNITMVCTRMVRVRVRVGERWVRRLPLCALGWLGLGLGLGRDG
jgi:hypothetical protein